MWLKMLGSTMVIGATTWMGLQIAYRYQQRPLQLREIQSSLQMLETEIHYGLTPLPRALEKLALTHRGRVGNFFATARKNLIHEPGITAREAWCKAIDMLWDQFALTDADREILINFGSTLGISDRHDQVKHVKLTMTQLANAETKAWEDKEKNERMFRTLGFLGGLAIVILLY
jgi:stage III sporulation protein AB